MVDLPNAPAFNEALIRHSLGFESSPISCLNRPSTQQTLEIVLVETAHIKLTTLKGPGATKQKAAGIKVISYMRQVRMSSMINEVS